MIDSEDTVLNSAAILCGHAALRTSAILYAIRDVPEEPADSGWQFLCGAKEEDWSFAQVWSVAEVLELIPTFSEFVSLPAGSELMRKDSSSPWEQLKK